MRKFICLFVFSIINTTQSTAEYYPEHFSYKASFLSSPTFYSCWVGDGYRRRVELAHFYFPVTLWMLKASAPEQILSPLKPNYSFHRWTKSLLSLSSVMSKFSRCHRFTWRSCILPGMKRAVQFSSKYCIFSLSASRASSSSISWPTCSTKLWEREEKMAEDEHQTQSGRFNQVSL